MKPKGHIWQIFQGINNDMIYAVAAIHFDIPINCIFVPLFPCKQKVHYIVSRNVPDVRNISTTQTSQTFFGLFRD